MVCFILLGIYQFLLSGPIRWCILFTVVSYDPLHLYGIICSISSFIYNFVWVLSLFFLVSLAKGLSISSFLKTQLLGSLIFPIVFLVSIYIISALLFIISFHLLSLSLDCPSFSNSCRFKVRLRLFFSLNAGRHLMLSLSLSTAFVASHSFAALFSFTFVSRLSDFPFASFFDSLIVYKCAA